jgi:hypothetical protein
MQFPPAYAHSQCYSYLTNLVSASIPACMFSSLIHLVSVAIPSYI